MAHPPLCIDTDILIDFLIARHMPLLTRNRAHFARVPHLTLVDPQQFGAEPA